MTDQDMKIAALQFATEAAKNGDSRSLLAIADEIYAWLVLGETK